MQAKIVAAIVTCVLNLAIGVAVLAVLVISLNGYAARPGQAALITYIVLGLAVTIAMSVGAFFVTGYLIKRKFSGVVAALIAVPVFSCVGAVLKIVCVFIGILIAEIVRVNF
ncbi:MAG: hypothetical protein ACKVQW_01360 [Pyrinomonadaceae bacterium]